MSLARVIDTTKSPAAKLAPLPINSVKFSEASFWDTYMQGNRTISIPKLFELFEKKGILDNFRRLAGVKDCERRGPYFTDSDIYKWMEAAAFALASGHDDQIREQLETAITTILPAQCEDGYLNTFFVDKANRFSNPDAHEFYCAGHYFQAAVAIYRSIGDDRVLKSAMRFADYYIQEFGPESDKKWSSGHPEIELALVELYRTTGEKKYLDFAEHILNQINIDASWKTHWSKDIEVKFEDRKELFGHAVRNGYLACGGSDVLAETGDAGIEKAMRRLWDSTVNRKIYITGGLGSRYRHEAIGNNFELTNFSYAETCAAISNVMWAFRNLQITGESQFADWLERSLYNGVLSGISLDYKKYFYVNPLVSLGDHERQEWFDTTCCPTNIQRLFSALPGYFYSSDGEGIWVHLYDTNSAEFVLADGTNVTLSSQTNYPYDGDINFSVQCERPASFALNLRIPGWADDYAVMVNGQKVDIDRNDRGYAVIDREWSDGDSVELKFELSIKFFTCNPRVVNNYCRVAIMRGPLVYCIEDVDNSDLKSIHFAGVKKDFKAIIADAEIKTADGFDRPITAITFDGEEIQTDDELYEATEQYAAKTSGVSLTAIPYYAWANRGLSQMTTWLAII